MNIRRAISIAAAAVSVGVCVFITYISRDVDQNTILFNLIFLAVMLFMLVGTYVFGLRRLIRVTGGLKKGIENIRNISEERLATAELGDSLFDNEFLDDCYRQYCEMSKRNPEGICDIGNFINEENIDTYVHRGILELIPDLLTSLGILGTFVGLVMGLREFDPSGYEQMAGSVTPLINGIKVAFITSIYGISLSLSYSFNIRSEFTDLTTLTDAFLDAFYLNVRPPQEVASISKFMESQKSQEKITEELTGIFVEQMGKSFEEAITPAFDLMTENIRTIVSSFTQAQEQMVSRICSNMTAQISSELSEEFSRINQIVEQTGNHQQAMLENCDRIISELKTGINEELYQMSQMVKEMKRTQDSYGDFVDHSLMHSRQTLAALQENLAQLEKYSSQSYDQLMDAQADAVRIQQEQKAAYQEYIRFMYQSIERYSDIWDKNGELLQRYADEISNMSPVQATDQIQQSLSAMTRQLQDVGKHLQTAEASSGAYLTELSAAEKEQSEMLIATLKKLKELEELAASPVLFRKRRKQ